jgi:hypothetical protein
VAHLEDIDRELHDRQAIEIRVHHQIGDVAVYEQLPGRIPRFHCRHTAVGTTDPQVGGRCCRDNLLKNSGSCRRMRSAQRRLFKKLIQLGMCDGLHGLVVDRQFASNRT